MVEEDNNTEERWEGLLDFLEKTVGKRPADLNAVMFLIGVGVVFN